MAGIYLHIPFCKSKCTYCDFYSIVNTSYQKRLVDAICNELEQRKSYLGNADISTIYLGGGTPSMLSNEELQRILDQITTVYAVSHNAEITIEVNPDDVTLERLCFLRSAGYNRLSMGVQSFNDNDLKFLNRRHSAKQAGQVVTWAKEAGFNDVSIDLIYGLPGQTIEGWTYNLEKAFALPVTHLSSYHLMYEEGTKLHKLKELGKVDEVTEELSTRFFTMLQEACEENGFTQYEVSNFCKPGQESQHNSNYWFGVPYLGIGPAAHSFDGDSRQWNVADIKRYVTGVETGKPISENEILSEGDRYNEMIITAFRTARGLDLERLDRLPEIYTTHFKKEVSKFVEQNILITNEKRIYLSKKGFLMSDAVMRDLMWIHDED